MSGKQPNAPALQAMSASDRVFSELDTLYETLDRLDVKLTSKFDNLYVQPLNTPEGILSDGVSTPASQVFSNLFSKTQACIYRVNRMIDYVNNCEN